MGLVKFGSASEKIANAQLEYVSRVRDDFLFGLVGELQTQFVIFFTTGNGDRKARGDGESGEGHIGDFAIHLVPNFAHHLHGHQGWHASTHRHLVPGPGHGPVHAHHPRVRRQEVSNRRYAR